MPKVVAHRGLRATYPENTLSSLRAALNLQVSAVEFDLELTSDDELVLLHQETLEVNQERTALQLASVDATRMWVREMSLAQIRKLDAGVWFDEKFKGEQIPTISEALELDWGDKTAFIELKDPNFFSKASDPQYARRLVEKACKPVKEFVSRGGSALILSFSPKVLEICSELIPEVPRNLCISRKKMMTIDDAIDLAKKLAASTITLNENIIANDSVWRQVTSESAINLGSYETSPTLEAHGTAEWSAESKSSSWKQLIELGVDYITTDFPEALTQFLSSTS